MSKQISAELLDTIQKAVKNFSGGASVENIALILVSPLSKRSLQRYLAILTMTGRLITKGNARARRYYAPVAESGKTTTVLFSQDHPIEDRQIKKTIPLSPAALSIQQHVCQSLQARHPVGYHREFLDKYRPNETYYLPESTRNHPLAIGKSSDSERPAGTHARHMLNRLLIDLSWNSSRLEGNTYSLLETERLLELGAVPAGKEDKEAQMILNHKTAIEFMIESAEQMRFNNFTILNLWLHATAVIKAKVPCDSIPNSSKEPLLGRGMPVFLLTFRRQGIRNAFDKFFKH